MERVCLKPKVLAAFFFCLFLCQSTPAQSQVWTIEVADSTAGSGRYSSLIIDPTTGNPTVVYSQRDKVQFAVRAGGVWGNLSLTSDYDRLEDIQLVATSTGYLFTAFYYGNIPTCSGISCLGGPRPPSMSAGFLRRPSGGSWSSSVAGLDGSKTIRSGQNMSLAVSPVGDFPYAIFKRDTDSFRLYEAFWDDVASDWTNATSAVSTTMLSQMALAIDSSGTLHSLYTVDMGGQPALFHHPASFVNPVSDWSGARTEIFNHGTLASTESTPHFFKDIVIDSNDFTHIIFYDPAQKNIQYSDGSTPPTVLDGGSSDEGQFLSLAVCGDDSLHASYYDNSLKGIKYVTRPSRSAPWSSPTIIDQPAGSVPASTDLGQHTSIFCDLMNGIHVTYYDASNQILKYASLPPLPDAVCGNGACEAGELCDACDSDCGICPSVIVTSCGDGTCDTGEDCNLCAQDCDFCPAVAACGNSVVEPAEECDDGNTTSGDGCSATCMNESSDNNDNQGPILTGRGRTEVARQINDDDTAVDAPQTDQNPWRFGSKGSGCTLIRAVSK